MIDNTNAKEEIFRLRCKYGKTQEQVSEGSGISRITINRIENGKLAPETIRAFTFFKFNEYFKKLGEK